MEDNQYIKEILQKIELEDACAFSRFAQEYPVCFQEKKGNWLFPMMSEFYTNEIHNENVISLLQELGLYMHNCCKKQEMHEVTRIDRSLCIDDSYIENYVLKVQKCQSSIPKFKDLNSPWRTRGISLSLYEMPTILMNSIIFEFKDYEHPYILADIASMYIYGQKLEESLNYLYRSLKQLVAFPNRYWNSEYGLAGAANTFRLLLLLCPQNNLELYKKIYMYDYLYLTKLAYTASDEVFQHEAYVNRASIVMGTLARLVIPLNINPDLLYISDTYYAHYCNELAEMISVSSGWKYNMKSLTYYQHASIRPNDTGGYADIEDKTYGEIVSEKHEQAKSIAFMFFTQICAGHNNITDTDIESLFKILQHEYRYNYKAIRNRTLNFKTYK